MNQSLKSRGYVKEQFAWRHYYWYLTNEGISYLRDFLHLPPEIVPSTLKRQARTETARARPAAKRKDIQWHSVRIFINVEFPLAAAGDIKKPSDRDQYRAAGKSLRKVTAYNPNIPLISAGTNS